MELKAQATRWHVREEDFEYYGEVSRLPCSVVIHLWERDLVAQGGTVVKADWQKTDDAAVPTELWERFLRYTLAERFMWVFPLGPSASRALDGAFDGGEESFIKVSRAGGGRIIL